MVLKDRTQTVARRVIIAIVYERFRQKAIMMRMLPDINKGLTTTLYGNGERGTLHQIRNLRSNAKCSVGYYGKCKVDCLL